MILLKEHTLTPKNYIRPESMSLTLEERTSTATMTLGPEAPEISVNDWLKGDTDPGKGIVWRVKAVAEDVDKETRTVTLEHVVQYLKDRVMFGEVKAEAISGGKTCTALAMASRAMKQQSEWKLGDFADNPSNAYRFNGETVYQILETITSTMTDCQWEYDLTSTPFTLHIRKIPTGVSSEMRMSRNITTMRRQIDRTRMYTRIYPIGKDNLHLSGEYLSKNEKTWGIVCKVETNQTKESEGELRAWAQERLNRHCEPLVTITVTGLDLSRATGESLDKLTIGRRCRVPLPDKGVTITERVTRLQWSDCIKEPEKFTVTMANNTEDIATIMNQIQEAVASGSGGGGGRYGAKKAEEDHAWFVDTTEHVGMVAEAVAGPGADKDWSRVASIFVDGEGIHQKVTQAQADIVEHETRIEMNEKSIELEAKERKDEDEDLLGKIQVEAGRVALVVGHNKNGNFIKAGQICIAINNSGDAEAVIEAKKIHLLGQTIANTITAELIQSKVSLMASLRVKKLTVATSVSFEGSGTVITGSQAADIIRNLRITQSGNTYKLQKITCGGGTWEDVSSFSRAVSSWSVGGGGGYVNVTANPQGQTKGVKISVGGPNSIGTNGTFTYKAYFENQSGDDVETGASETVTVSIQPTNVQRKSSGIIGTSLGNFAGVSGNYITLSVGGYNYYIRIA